MKSADRLALSEASRAFYNDVSRSVVLQSPNRKFARNGATFSTSIGIMDRNVQKAKCRNSHLFSGIRVVEIR